MTAKAKTIPQSEAELWVALAREVRAAVAMHALIIRGDEPAEIPTTAYGIADGMDEESGFEMPAR